MYTVTTADKFSFFKGDSFKDFILRINKYKPNKEFGEAYYIELKSFVEQAKELRNQLQLQKEN